MAEPRLFVEILGESRRERAESERRKENARRARRIAVGILAAAERDLNRFVEIAVPVEKPDENVRAVNFDVDIEIALYVGARPFSIVGIELILLVNLLPARLPVVGNLLFPLQKVANHFRVSAPFRNRLERLLDNLNDVRFKKRFGVHRANELARVHAVPVVHETAEFLAHTDRVVRKAGRNEAGKVRLDLIVDVVGAMAEFGPAGVRRRDSAAEIFAAVNVRVPERIFAVGEIDSRLTDRAVQPMLFHRAQEGHLDVDIVLTERVIDHVGRPFRRFLFRNNAPAVAEFRRRAPADAGDLANPAALHLIAILRD